MHKKINILKILNTFLKKDGNNLPIKHTKIQRDDGTWRIEFIPTTTGLHHIKRILQIDENKKCHLLHRINVLNYGEQRVLYGYKLYDSNESVQLVFDAVNFNVNDILPEVKGLLANNIILKLKYI